MPRLGTARRLSSHEAGIGSGHGPFRDNDPVRISRGQRRVAPEARARDVFGSDASAALDLFGQDSRRCSAVSPSPGRGVASMASSCSSWSVSHPRGSCGVSRKVSRSTLTTTGTRNPSRRAAASWSSAVLEHQIANQLHARIGAAPSNFADRLPAPDSDLAQQLLRDRGGSLNTTWSRP